MLVWLFNVYGVRPAVWFGYVTGGLLCIPVFVLMFFPYITGDWHSSNMQWNIGTGGGLPLVLTWLYFMCWSSYGIEVVATFAPEYHDTSATRRRRCARRRCSASRSTPCCRSAWAARWARRRSPTTRRSSAFYTQAFDELVGHGLANVMIVCIVGGLVLSMNTATMDGSRALYGISKDGMTIRELGVLNRFRVPGRAMTLDAILNIFLITYFAGVLRDPRGQQHRLRVRHVLRAQRLPAAAQGPAELAAPDPAVRTSGCRSARVLLRDQHRSAGRAAASSTRAASSGSRATATAGTRPAPACWCCSRRFLLYVYRHVVQDKIPLRLREEIPQTPEELEVHPELAPPASATGRADRPAGPAAEPPPPSS